MHRAHGGAAFLPIWKREFLCVGGRRMKTEELQAVKNELQQLSVEVKRFKEELLTARVEELEQIVHSDHILFLGTRVRMRSHHN